jgi:hypothetical protein
MNKRTVLASLNKIANELDNSGLHNEANTITKVMVKLAYDEDEFEKTKYKLRYDTSQTAECPDCGEILFDGECDECGYIGENIYDPSNYEEYFKRNPDVPRTYEEAYFEQNPDVPRTYEEAYFKQNPDAPRRMKPEAE